MQNAAFAAAGLDAVYVALPVAPDRLGEAHRRRPRARASRAQRDRAAQAGGRSRSARRLDPVAAARRRREHAPARGASGWEGFNTDAPACLARSLEAAGVGRGARALLLGAGGAARAAAWALLRAGRGAADRGAAAREPPRSWPAALAPADRAGVPIPRAGRLGGRSPPSCRAADVVVNGTSVGLAGTAPASSRRSPSGAGQVAVDFVYGDTAFVRAGARRRRPARHRRAAPRAPGRARLHPLDRAARARGGHGRRGGARTGEQ